MKVPTVARASFRRGHGSVVVLLVQDVEGGTGRCMKARFFAGATATRKHPRRHSMATRPRSGSAATLVDALSELFFGNEQAEQLEDTLGRLVAPGFRQRINGKVYGREEYTGHVREMRASVDGGRVDVVEQLQDGSRIAGRYLFHVSQAAGQEATFESSIFAQLAPDGRIERLAEVARVAEGGDDQEMMSVP